MVRTKNITIIGAVATLLLLSASIKSSCSLEESNDLILSSKNSNLALHSVRSGEDGFNLDTLQLVQVIYRHGDRSPMEVYPTDPYNKNLDTYWPMGLGQLTQLGIDQHHELGNYFRTRYDGFLSSQYSPKDVHILSSIADRALQSAEANMFALFPEDNQTGILRSTRIWPQKLFSMNSLPLDRDNLICMTSPCKRKIDSLNDVYTSNTDYLKLAGENRELLNFLEEKMQLPKKTNIFDTVEYIDILNVQKIYNMTLPPWATDELLDKINKIREKGFALKFASTNVLKRLTSGPLLKMILNNMLSFEKQSKLNPPGKDLKQNHKMLVYSGHDVTLAAIMLSLGVFNAQMPPYASTFIVELHRKPTSGNFFVQLYYRNSTILNAFLLQVPGCEMACPLSKLNYLMKPFIPVNWEDECEVGNKEVFTKKSSDLIPSSGNSEKMAFLWILCIAILVCIAIVFVTRSNNSKLVYMLGTKYKTVNNKNDYIQIM